MSGAAYDGPMRILIVEDEVGIARFLERALRSEGFATEVAGDGERGQALALTGDFDLVLLDVMLPRRGGLEVLEAIRRDRPEVPVIMLTALGEKEDVVEGLDHGADDYVTKPFDLDELLARIRAQLRRPAQRDPTRLEAADITVDLHTREVTRNGNLRASDGTRVRAARLSDAPPEPGAIARADPERRLGLRLRPGHERAQRLRQLPAPQAHGRW